MPYVMYKESCFPVFFLLSRKVWLCIIGNNKMVIYQLITWLRNNAVYEIPNFVGMMEIPLFFHRFSLVE